MILLAIAFIALCLAIGGLAMERAFPGLIDQLAADMFGAWG